MNFSTTTSNTSQNGPISRSGPSTSSTAEAMMLPNNSSSSDRKTLTRTLSKKVSSALSNLKKPPKKVRKL